MRYNSIWGRFTAVSVYILTGMFIPLMCLFAQPEWDWIGVYGTDDLDFCYGIYERESGDFIFVGDAHEVFGQGTGNAHFVLAVDSTGEEQWRQYYEAGGSSSLTGVIELENGDLLVSGSYSVYGFAMRLNSEGDEIWSRIYEELGVGLFTDLIKTNEGQYVIYGLNSVNDIDVWLVKIDDNGELIWSHTYGGAGSQWGTKILQTVDGGFVGTGGTGNRRGDAAQPVVFKVDLDGEQEWQCTFSVEENRQNTENGTALVQDRDGTLIVGGYSQDPDRNYQSFLARLDEDGNLLYSSFCENKFMAELKISNLDGSILAVGEGRGYYMNHAAHLWFGKFDRNFEQQWELFVDGGATEGFVRVRELPDYSYIVAGTALRAYRREEPGRDNFVIAKTLPDPLALEPIRMVIDDRGFSFGSAPVDSVITDELLIFNIGQRYGDLIRVELTENCGAFLYDFDEPIRSFPQDTIKLPLHFSPYSADEFTDCLRCFVGPDTISDTLSVILTGRGVPNEIITEDENLPPELSLTGAYPNPFNSTATISYQVARTGEVNITIYDLSGRVVTTLQQGVQQPGTCAATWDAGGVPSGMYLVQMTAGDFRQVRKAMLVR